MDYLESIKKHGITASLVFAILYLNGKMNEQERKIESVEARLYDCYEDKIQQRNLTKSIIQRYEILAVLPEKSRIRHARTKQEV